MRQTNIKRIKRGKIYVLIGLISLILGVYRPVFAIDSQTDSSGVHTQNNTAQNIGTFTPTIDFNIPSIDLYMWTNYPTGNGALLKITGGIVGTSCYYYMEDLYPAIFPTTKPLTADRYPVHSQNSNCILRANTEYTFIFSGGNTGTTYSIAMNSNLTLPYFILNSTTPPTCSDGIKNQSETFVDYGGICANISTNESGINILTPIPADNVISPVIFSGQFNQGNDEYDNILLYITNATTEQGQTILVSIPTTPNANGNWSTSLSLLDGQYFVMARFYNSVNYTFGAWYPSETAKIVSFTVGNPIIVCDTLDLFCYIKQGLTWAFVPDFESFNQFTQLKDDLSKKPPFGYITGIYTAMADVTNTTGDNSFTLESTTPIMDLIFTPIRSALSWILYFAFAFMLFLRFRDIQI